MPLSPRRLLWPGLPPRSPCPAARASGRDISRIAAGGGGMGLGASRTIGAGVRSCGGGPRRSSRGAGAECDISRIGAEVAGMRIDWAGSRGIGAARRSCNCCSRSLSRRGSWAVTPGCGISRIVGARRDGSGAGEKEGAAGVWRARCSTRGGSGIADGLGTALPGWRSSATGKRLRFSRLRLSSGPTRDAFWPGKPSPGLACGACIADCGFCSDSPGGGAVERLSCSMLRPGCTALAPGTSHSLPGARAAVGACPSS